MLCGRKRIKPTQKHTSMGMTAIEHITEGMCRQCAWERVKHKCKICNRVIGKGYPRLLAHIISHYTSNELLHKEDIEMDIIISINFERAKTLPNEWVVDKEEEKGQYPIKCKICGDTFMLKKEEITMFSKWIDHIKSHYLDKDLVKKSWIAKDIVHLNYDSVILLKSSNHHKGNKSNSSNDNNYRDLTKREINAYRNALRSIRTEESITVVLPDMVDKTVY